MNFNKIYLFAISAALLLINACTDPDPVKPVNPINDQEDITQVYLQYNVVGSSTIVKKLIFSDVDGLNGSKAPVLDSLTLAANTNYNFKIIILNTLNTPADTISNEILEEGTQHQFFLEADFTPATQNILITKTDKDANNNAIGLLSTWATKAATKGHTHLKLTHYDNEAEKKNAPNNETIGETDIEFEFDVEVK